MDTKGYTVKSNAKGRVTDVTCGLCNKLVPFNQPDLSVSPTEVSIISHSCPPQILSDVQDAIVETQAAMSTA